MANGLFSGYSGIALGKGLYRKVNSLWSGAYGLITGWGQGPAPGDTALRDRTEAYIYDRAEDLIYTRSAS